MSRKFSLNDMADKSITRRGFLQGSSLAVGAATLGGLWPNPGMAAGSMTWYSGLALKATDAVTQKYGEKTGAKIEYFRAGSNKLVQKFDQELKADQVQCSALLLASPTLLDAWSKKGLLLKYDSPEFANYPSDFVIDGYAAPTSAETLGMARNTEMVSDEEAPKHWEDLLDPKWKGKIVMTDPTSASSALHWYAALRKTYGKSYMENLAKQDVLVRVGGATVADTLISGERSIAAVITASHTSRGIAKGGKLRVIAPEEGQPLIVTMIAMPAKAPEPELGKGLVDFILNIETQTMLQNDYLSASMHKDAPPMEGDTGAMPVNKVKPMASSRADMEEFLAEQGTLIQEYTDLFK